MSLPISARGALFDIEGTTSAVAYVYDIMFPYARARMGDYVAERWDDAVLEPVKEQFAHDAGAESFAAWTGGSADPRQALLDEAARLMDGDIKATGLKQLQGLVWEAGFRDGRLRAHVYDDVAPALRTWLDAGVDLRVYSSGSVHAQKLFFGHTEAGDLLPLFTGHYDTTTGPKREAPSYTTIAEDWGLPPGQIVFFSDVTEELDAARAAGLQTLLVRRPGNADPSPHDPPHAMIDSFDEVTLTA